MDLFKSKGSYGILNPKQVRSSKADIATSCTTKKALSVSIFGRKCQRTKNTKKKAKKQEKAGLKSDNICQINNHKQLRKETNKTQTHNNKIRHT